MNIVYEYYATEQEPTVDQIIISGGSSFTECYSPTTGGLMKITASTMRMSITSTTFTNIWTDTNGGVFYCDGL